MDPVQLQRLHDAPFDRRRAAVQVELPLDPPQRQAFARVVPRKRRLLHARSLK